jgi:signal peptidase II
MIAIWQIPFLVIGIISLDQITKWFFERGIYLILWAEECLTWVIDTLHCHSLTVYNILGEWIRFERTYNTWVAFSFPIEWWFLKVLTICLLVFIGVYYWQVERSKKHLLLDYWYVFIFAWALSHAYERIFIGHVVDFVALKYFAVFNIADVFITIWAGLIILYYTFYERRK